MDDQVLSPLTGVPAVSWEEGEMGLWAHAAMLMAHAAVTIAVDKMRKNFIFQSEPEHRLLFLNIFIYYTILAGKFQMYFTLFNFYRIISLGIALTYWLNLKIEGLKRAAAGPQ